MQRRAAAGDDEALAEFAHWAYGQVRHLLDRPSRRTVGGSPADEAEDDVQTAMVFVLGGLGRCRAENDYQLAAWLDLVAWRGVLRGRIEQRSLDAVAAAGATGVRRLSPDALTQLIDGATSGTGRASIDGIGRRGTPRVASPGVAALGVAAPGGMPPAEVLWRALAAAIGVDGAPQTWMVPAGRGVRREATRDVGTGVRRDTDPTLAAELGRLHAEEVHAFLCRLAVCAYAELPADTQHIFWERLVAGRAWAEVADTVGLREPAAKRRVERAVRVLAQRVLDYLATLPPAVAVVVAAHCRRLGVTVPVPPTDTPGVCSRSGGEEPTSGDLA